MNINTTLILGNSTPLSVHAATENKYGDIRLTLSDALLKQLSALSGFPVSEVTMVEHDFTFTLVAERTGAHRALSMADCESNAQCFNITNQAEAAQLYSLVTGF